RSGTALTVHTSEECLTPPIPHRVLSGRNGTAGVSWETLKREAGCRLLDANSIFATNILYESLAEHGAIRENKINP
ncbi:hypothetical protein, partial [Methylorubrum zatmanii]|uniref:hypothetical protein n=1 Tax=Methylorubrum zatmanii TaxID=29429 RepID=UPI001AEE4B2A